MNSSCSWGRTVLKASFLPVFCWFIRFRFRNRFFFWFRKYLCFRFKDFTGALVYVNRIGEMANEQQHHPDIYLAWGKVRVDVWTHKIDGLTESDFIFAARADQLVESQEPSRNAGQQ